MDEQVTQNLDTRIGTLQDLLDWKKEGRDVQRTHIVDAQLQLARAFIAYARQRCFDCDRRTNVVADIMAAADTCAASHDWYE